MPEARLQRTREAYRQAPMVGETVHRVLIDGPGVNFPTRAGGQFHVEALEPGERRRIVLDGQVIEIERRTADGRSGAEAFAAACRASVERTARMSDEELQGEVTRYREAFASRWFRYRVAPKKPPPFGLVLLDNDGSLFRPSPWVRLRVWLRRVCR